MGNSSLLGRRRFLLLGVVPAAIGTLGIPACSNNGRTPTSSSYAPTYFSAAEWTFINAAVGRLIPPEGDGVGGVDAGIPEFIDRQMELPYGHGAYFYLKGPFLDNPPPALGYQLRYTPREIYRLGIAAANSATQKSQNKDFAQLPAADQDHFLTAMEKDETIFATVPATVFFAQLLTNCKEGYFSDPLYGGNRGMVAWKWIGFPGARADFTDWIDQAGRRYPYGAVSISGATDA
ncbi:MAG TPA: gluconate 2-dehydrogenase subunit 3 family protein [Steroidobacteraceae bacterium]|jgi:gluconate 2-dehydrogenase gamma chain|nr:gluconate 2-dehydrogenase subunit 3 family protein [Steroidobacteraceae bacterium]